MQIKKIEKGGRKNDDNNSNPGNIIVFLEKFIPYD